VTTQLLLEKVCPRGKNKDFQKKVLFLLSFVDKDWNLMRRFYRALVGADPHRQFLKHLLFPGELEDTATRPFLVFALQIALAAATCAGTILALFAWSGAAL
jgi:hypothetical protein